MTDSNNLWRRVMRTSTARLEHPLSRFPSSHSKVGDLDVLVTVQQQVLRLEIAVADVESVAVVHGVDDLLEIVKGL